MKEKIHNVMNFIAYIAFVVIIVALIPKVLVYLLGTPYPMATVTSSSMWPDLKRGDLVIVEHASPKRLKKGMVIVYDDPGGKGLVIHRIVRIAENKIVTKGDANETADDPIKSSRIMGVVPTIRGKLIKIPYLGYITLLVRKRPK